MNSIIYLKVLITYKCSSRCKHCIFCCSPEADGLLDIPRFSLWFDEILKDNTVQIFEIHGGEPMLYPEHVHRLAELAKQRQIPERWLTTNCSWAADSKIALAEVKRLQEAGVSRLNFSTDAFHAEFIPVDRIRSAVCAAEQVGVEYRIFAAFIGSPTAPKPPNDQTKTILEQVTAEWEEKTDPFPVMFAGRANKELLEQYGEDRGVPNETCDDMICAATGNPYKPHGLEIDCFGNILIANGITVGNANETPVLDILSRYDVQNNPIMKVIAMEGPIGLTKIPEAKGFKLRRGYTDRCQLCYEVRKYLHPHFPGILTPKIRYNE